MKRICELKWQFRSVLPHYSLCMNGCMFALCNTTTRRVKLPSDTFLPFSFFDSSCCFCTEWLIGTLFIFRRSSVQFSPFLVCSLGDCDSPVARASRRKKQNFSTWQMALDLGQSGCPRICKIRRGKCSVWFVQYLAN